MYNPNANQGHTEKSVAICVERTRMWQFYVANYQYHLDQGSEQFQKFSEEFREKFLTLSI